MDYDAEVAWLVNEACNFDCTYCWLAKIDKEKRFKGHQSTQKIVNSFNRHEIVWLIHMTGGEPFLSPHYVKLCQDLTKNHFISINTNLTHKDVYRFGETIDPQKVAFIHSSCHIEERERLGKIDDFIEKFHFLQDRGFFIFASYLMSPGVVKRFDQDYAFFKSQGIILRPKVCWGYEAGANNLYDNRVIRVLKRIKYMRTLMNRMHRSYPEAYSKKERRLIESLIEMSTDDFTKSAVHFRPDIQRTVDLALDINWLTRLPSFKGIHCQAGSKFVRMEKNGDVFRCIDEKHYFLGNLFTDRIKFFETSIPCESPICSCPYIGFRYTSG
jgi:sulfatase maturation enzyme AslB (radical SAM superfamily)